MYRHIIIYWLRKDIFHDTYMWVDDQGAMVGCATERRHDRSWWIFVGKLKCLADVGDFGIWYDTFPSCFISKKQRWWRWKVCFCISLLWWWWWFLGPFLAFFWGSTELTARMRGSKVWSYPRRIPIVFSPREVESNPVCRFDLLWKFILDAIYIHLLWYDSSSKDQLR